MYYARLCAFNYACILFMLCVTMILCMSNHVLICYMFVNCFCFLNIKSVKDSLRSSKKLMFYIVFVYIHVYASDLLTYLLIYDNMLFM